MIRDTPSDAKPEIDLRGPGGNAFALLGNANKLARDLGFDSETVQAIQKEMTAGDYENLLVVFDKHFGDYVDLVR